MKRIFMLIILMSSIGGSVFGQNCSIKKGYAFERSTLSGTPPRKVLEESGNQIERPVKNNTTYFIYMEIKNSCHIEPSRIWINRKPYLVRKEEVTAPVIINYEQPRTTPDTLVKQTKNKIIRLLPTTELNDTANSWLSNKISGSKIVIEYLKNSKPFYHTIKDLKKLPPLVLQ
jgi:hypothetical protein